MKPISRRRLVNLKTKIVADDFNETWDKINEIVEWINQQEKKDETNK